MVKEASLGIVAIGNALLDIIAFVDSELPPSFGFHAGSTTHLSTAELLPILQQLESPFFSAGGGAANVARVAAQLGVKATLVGAVGDDPFGKRYRDDLEGQGITALLSDSDKPTGLFCALIDQNGGKTILVAPGAALEVTRMGDRIKAVSGDLLYFDGFVLHDRAFFLDCVRWAKARGMRVALDLGASSLVASMRAFLREALPGLCDFVFANEEEFLALMGTSVRKGLNDFAGEGCCVVVKLAERGALCASGGQVFESPVRAVKPFDDTGAGDAFAGAFLAARAQGMSVERCLRLANRIAEESLGVAGGAMDSRRIRTALASVN
ncbi:MAG: carbohydrate kinase family protein [Spirochaetota bacterium]